MKETRFELYCRLVERFNEGELRTLCFRLGIDYDDLIGEGKSDKARELIAYLERRASLSRLMEVGKQLRPDISWDVASKVDSPDIGAILDSYLQSHPPLDKDRVIAGLEQQFDSLFGWYKSSALWGVITSETETPDKLSCLSILNIENGIYAEIELRVQLEERYIFDFVSKPSGRSTISKEMETYSLSKNIHVIPLLEKYTANQAIPGTYKEIQCEHCHGTATQSSRCPGCKGKGVQVKEAESEPCEQCKGKGEIETKCPFCYEGKWGSHRRQERKVYPLMQSFFSHVFSDSLKKYTEPHTLDILWASPVQKWPFEKQPFNITSLEDSIAKKIQDSFERLVREINSRTRCNTMGSFIDTNDLIRHSLGSLYKHRGSLSEVTDILLAFGVTSDEYYDVRDVQIENVFANEYQIAMKAIPIYKVTYNRSTSRTSKVLFWKKASSIVLEGEIFLCGVDNLSVYSHSESESCI
jgi:hypothetical protein